MIETVIKYFFIMMTTSYLFVKLQNIKKSKMNTMYSVVFSLVLAVIIYYLRLKLAPLSIIFPIILFDLFAIIVYKSGFNITVSASIISFGISHFLFVACAFISLPIGFLMGPVIGYGTMLNIISHTVIGIFQLFFAALPFRFKRYKNGMPFLLKQGAGDIMVFICVSILFVTSFFTMQQMQDIYLIIPIFIIVLSGLLVFFYGKRQLTQMYIKRAKERDLSRMEEALRIQQEELHAVMKENEELSKIIHKDNKLIPAMEHTVKELLVNENNPKNIMLLDTLTKMSAERKGIINHIEKSGKKITSTDIISVDAIIEYMLNKAKNQKTNLEFLLNCNLKDMINSVVSENDFNTLLADILENALIATAGQELKNVLLTIGVENGSYFINV